MNKPEPLLPMRMPFLYAVMGPNSTFEKYLVIIAYPYDWRKAHEDEIEGLWNKVYEPYADIEVDRHEFTTLDGAMLYISEWWRLNPVLPRCKNSLGVNNGPETSS